MIQKRIALIVAIAFLALVFWFSYPLQQLFFEALEYIEAFHDEHPVLSIMLFVGIGILASLLGPVGSAPFVPPAVTIWGEGETFWFLLSGWILGALISYGVGYWGGYPLIRKMFGENKILKYQHVLNKKSQFAVVLAARLALPAEIMGYGMGALRYAFAPYMLATLIAEIIFAFITVYASGAFLAGDIETVAVFLILAALIIIISIRAMRAYHVRAHLVEKEENKYNEK